jgi:putative Holliday junction resolvase
MARICRQLAEHVEALGRPVHLIDERLTSLEAETTLLDESLKASQRNRRRDAEAACLILERFLAVPSTERARMAPRGGEQ